MVLFFKFLLFNFHSLFVGKQVWSPHAHVRVLCMKNNKLLAKNLCPYSDVIRTVKTRQNSITTMIKRFIFLEWFSCGFWNMFYFNEIFNDNQSLFLTCRPPPLHCGLKYQLNASLFTESENALQRSKYKYVTALPSGLPLLRDHSHIT